MLVFVEHAYLGWILYIRTAFDFKESLEAP